MRCVGLQRSIADAFEANQVAGFPESVSGFVIGASSRFEISGFIIGASSRFEIFSLKFSSSSFAIRVNLLHP